MIDLKGLARPEKFDGLDEHWLEWKDSFRSVMNLLDVTPYLDAIVSIISSYLTVLFTRTKHDLGP
eukprot:11111048-Heterocapsa_arctica.AAC.1